MKDGDTGNRDEGPGTNAAEAGRGSPEPLERAQLAYENPAFLNSADGRLIRIVSEYTEPLARFRRERIQDTVVFFGSARFHAMPDEHPATDAASGPVADHPVKLLQNTG